MKVRNMRSTNGNTVPNQFNCVDDNGNEYFQSYNSVIVKKESDKIFLDKQTWNYSVTTSRYRNIFLDESTKETQKKIDSGEYILTDLN